MSGGRGIVETEWARPDALCTKARAPIGFAGGLSPENVGDALKWMVGNTARNPFCPVCVAKLPKAHPSILLPQQVCKIHGFRDPRPRLTQGDAP